MKKWLFAALVGCVAVAVQAEEGTQKEKGKKDGSVTKAQYVENQRKMAEKKGQEFDQAKTEARFDKMDTNKDGVLSPEEKAHAQKKKEKGAEQPAAE